jgi:hypothetical protein
LPQRKPFCLLPVTRKDVQLSFALLNLSIVTTLNRSGTPLKHSQCEINDQSTWLKTLHKQKTNPTPQSRLGMEHLRKHVRMYGCLL